jgi:hypothetical protein
MPPKGLGLFDFEMWIDGESVPADFVSTMKLSTDGAGKLWVFNFPEGLPAGTYEVNGVWSYPCMAYDHPPSTCDSPADVVIFEWTNTVVFE